MNIRCVSEMHVYNTIQLWDILKRSPTRRDINHWTVLSLSPHPDRREFRLPCSGNSN